MLVLVPTYEAVMVGDGWLFFMVAVSRQPSGARVTDARPSERERARTSTYSLDSPLRDQNSQGGSNLLASSRAWGHLLALGDIS